jgi:cysteine desulfurase
MRTIYLDYNATTPLAPAVQEAMLPFLAEHYGNPSSHHALGRAAQEAVEDARVRVARLVGAERHEIVFTSGGTESNNLALKGAAFRNSSRGAGHFVLTALEHASVRQSAIFLESLGFPLTVVRCNADGIVDRDAIQAALRRNTILVSVIHANHEIGAIQPIAEIARMCRARGVLVHTDASQSAGKILVNVDHLGVDLLTISGHKMYAPKGVGALYIRRGVDLAPLIHGESQEAGLRAGVENVSQIVGLGTAATLAAETHLALADKIESLRDRLESRLLDDIPGSSVNAQHDRRLPNTLSINFPGVSANDVLRRAPDICAATGEACHCGSSSLSDTLAAIGLTSRLAHGTIRLSLGVYTSEEDVDRAAEALITAWEIARADV